MESAFKENMFRYRGFLIAEGCDNLFLIMQLGERSLCGLLTT